VPLYATGRGFLNESCHVCHGPQPPHLSSNKDILLDTSVPQSVKGSAPSTWKRADPRARLLVLQGLYHSLGVNNVISSGWPPSEHASEREALHNLSKYVQSPSRGLLLPYVE
jgi:hypothetical protein